MMTIDKDIHWMGRAIELAQEAERKGEVPVGAILIINDELVATGHNEPISTNDPTAHAEIVTLRRAAREIGNYRLPESTLYVTLEPCAMCIGAILHARISRLVYGADDPKAGAVQSVHNILEESEIKHSLEWKGGVLSPECGDILREFFRIKRLKSTEKKGANI